MSRMEFYQMFAILSIAGLTHSATTTDSWQQIASRPDTTADPECLRLESFKHLYIIKGLDACEPHHISWHHLQELTNTNWRCRENIINVMSDRYDQGSTVSQYCNCKPYMWSDNGQLKGAVKTTKKVLEGVAPECFHYKGCQELKVLYENDTCAVHEIIWESLKNCPSDIDVEGQPVSCQATIVKKMYDRFNGSLEQYENDRCFCYPSFGLKTVPADCTKYGGFSRLHVNGLIPNNCMTHFSVWKYLATQPAVCQDWIINFMLDQLNDDFSCDCHYYKEPPKTGHGVSFVGRSLNKRGRTVLLHFPSIRLAFCVPKTGEGSRPRSAVIGCKDTPFLPSCEHDSQGWKVMQTDFLSNVCRSHWYTKFASTVPHCKCDSKMMSTPTPLPTTTMPPHMCNQCNGTSCDTTGASVTCGTNQNFCMTSIIDYNDNNSGKLERLIERKCASKQECTDKDQSGNMFCLQLPQGNLGFPYTCRFCCVGSNCNNPPALIPALSTRFSTNFP